MSRKRKSLLRTNSDKAAKKNRKRCLNAGWDES